MIKFYISILPLILMPVYAKQVLELTKINNKFLMDDTSKVVFDESINLAPNFNLSQNDDDLREYFSSNGKSELCLPTVLASLLIYDTFISKKMNPTSSKFSGSTQVLNQLDANELIKEISKKCNTNYEKGTNIKNSISCVSTLTREYSGKNIYAKIIQMNRKEQSTKFIKYINRQPSVIAPHRTGPLS